MKQRQPHIRYVQSSLVASFPKADPPVVWCFDLGRNHSFSVALRGVNDGWELGVTSPDAAFQTIARFNERIEAEAAFECLSKTLAHGRFGWLRHGLKISLWVMVGLIALYVGLLAAMQARLSAPQPAAQQEINPIPAPGEPVTADDVLTPPSP